MPAARIVYMELAARRRSLAPVRYTACIFKKEFVMNYSAKLISVFCLAMLLVVVGLQAGEFHAAVDSTTVITTKNPQPSLDVTYLAHEGFMVCTAGKKVLIDALFEPNFATEIGLRPEILKAIIEAQKPFNEIDLILVTHKDDDHFHAASVLACLQSNPKCRLVAPTQVVDLMRSIDGFTKIEHQIHEIKLKVGAHEQVIHNGVTVDVLCLYHEHRPQTINLAFVVEVGGARFVHMGDAFFAESESYLRSYPFEQAHIDLLFLNQYDRYGCAPKVIAERVKPFYIVAMHVDPDEFTKVSTKIRSVYPSAILFEKPMERRTFVRQRNANSNDSQNIESTSTRR